MLGFATIYRDNLPAYRRLILSRKQAKNAKSGKMRQIEDANSSQIVVKTLEFVNFTVQEIAAMLLLNPYSDKNIPSESAHRIVGIRAVVKSEHGIIAPFTEQRSALAADIIRRSDPA